jgi:hypothetical protein
VIRGLTVGWLYKVGGINIKVNCKAASYVCYRLISRLIQSYRRRFGVGVGIGCEVIGGLWSS